MAGHSRRDLGDLGPVFASPLVSWEPVDRGTYQHLEYAPLINARAHRLGDRRTILNDGLAAQWQAFVEQLAHRPRPRGEDYLAAAHYLFAMGRPDEAIAVAGPGRRDRVAGRAAARLPARLRRRGRRLSWRWRAARSRRTATTRSTAGAPASARWPSWWPRPRAAWRRPRRSTPTTASRCWPRRGREGNDADGTRVMIAPAEQDVDTRIEFQVVRRSGAWLVNDISIDGSSIMAKYQAQFTRIRREGSFSDLMEYLKQKAVIA